MNKIYVFLEINQHVLREKIYWFIRKYLSQYYQANFEEIQIRKEEYGKPYALRGAEKVDIYFNISHTFEVGIVVFSQDDIGVDIEEIGEPDYRIIKRYYRESEQKYVLEYECETSKAERFYEVWTKKEAYLKHTGQGLAGGLSKIDVLEMEYEYRKCVWCGKEYAIAIFQKNLSNINWEIVKT